MNIYVTTKITSDPSDDQLAAAAATLKMLSDSTGLRILWALLHGEHSVNELAAPIETDAASSAPPNAPGRVAKVRFGAVMNRRRWIEVARIVVVGVFVLAYARHWVPLGVLWATVAVG